MSTMKTYWDFTDQERASLTDEQVRSLLNIELMTAGVLRPEPPKLIEIPKSPLGERQKFYSVVAKGKYGSDDTLSVVFDTIQAAESFIALNPSIRDYDYEVGHDFTYVKPIAEAKIAVEELYSLDQINAFRVQLKQRKASVEANSKAQSAFSEASAKADKVTERVWSDWYQQKETKAKLQGIVSTYQEYLKLTASDAEIALTFLAKVHLREDIEQAREWFPGSIPERVAKVAIAEVAA